MQIPKLTNHDGTLTVDGQKVANFVEANIADMADMNAEQLNSKAGIFRYAFTRTRLNDYTVAQLLHEQETQFGQNAWSLMHYFEEQQQQTQQVQETAAKTDDLAAALEKLREDFAGQIAALKMENGKLRKQMKALKEDESAETEEPAADEDETPTTEETEDESEDKQ